MFKVLQCHYKYTDGANTAKTCLKKPLKNRQNTYLNDKWYINEGQKYF